MLFGLLGLAIQTGQSYGQENSGLGSQAQGYQQTIPQVERYENNAASQLIGGTNWMSLVHPSGLVLRTKRWYPLGDIGISGEVDAGGILIKFCGEYLHPYVPVQPIEVEIRAAIEARFTQPDVQRVFPGNTACLVWATNVQSGHTRLQIWARLKPTLYSDPRANDVVIVRKMTLTATQ